MAGWYGANQVIDHGMLVNGETELVSCERRGNLGVLSCEHPSMDTSETNWLRLDVKNNRGHHYTFNMMSNFPTVVFPYVKGATYTITGDLTLCVNGKHETHKWFMYLRD